MPPCLNRRKKVGVATEAMEAMETVERNISETTITIRSHLPKTEVSSQIQEAFRMAVAAGKG